MSGDDYNNLSPNSGTFDSRSVVSGDTLIKYTYAGDINLDGLVDDNDLFQFLGAYLGSQIGNYAQGDMNYDGLVNDDDLFIFLGNYLDQPTVPLNANVGPRGLELASVPEPASLGLLGLGALCVLLRKSRRNTDRGLQ